MRHLDEWRRRVKASPEVAADELRPDRVREIERERWLKGWLMNGSGTPLFPEVAPWPCEYHMRVSIPQIDEWTDLEAIAVDWQRHRKALLARAKETGRRPWAEFLDAAPVG